MLSAVYSSNPERGAMNMAWAEPLPEDCPPDSAFPPENQVFFRLVVSFPPNEQDFDSVAKLHPSHNYGSRECEARACSVWDTRKRCAKELKNYRHKGKRIARLVLPPSSGRVEKTTNTRGHYSWWRDKDFDVQTVCEDVT